MRILHRRDDGSFVIERDGLPYHATADDPIYSDVLCAYDGREYPPEPVVQPVLPVLRITRHQFASELFARGLISGSEMIALMVSATPPHTVKDIVDNKSQDERWLFLAHLAQSHYTVENPAFLSSLEAFGVAEVDAFMQAAVTR